MGGEAMGLNENEMKLIVTKWRKANPAIVQLWYDLEQCAVQALKTRKAVTSQHKGLVFEYNGEVLTVQLPSRRKLFYQSPSFSKNKWENLSIRYKGTDQNTKQWGWVDTYGGKITENIVQAIARDLLAEAMQRVDKAGFAIVLHVHDEIVVELLSGVAEKHNLAVICELMGQTSDVYNGVPFPAEGYLTPFYKKD
jgi:DNA polymerase